jgi:hypothetical protein
MLVISIFSVFIYPDSSAGITPLTYVPPTVPMKQSQWPTLGEMIDSRKRVVVFLDAGANTSHVNFILPEFEMVSVFHDLQVTLIKVI